VETHLAEAIGVGEVMLARSAASATVLATVHLFDRDPSLPTVRCEPIATATLVGMGSRGQKPRKPEHSEHLPKVGTATENERALHEEREAVLDNIGLAGTPSWLKLTIGVVAVLVVIGAVIALVALN